MMTHACYHQAKANALNGLSILRSKAVCSPSALWRQTWKNTVDNAFVLPASPFCFPSLPLVGVAEVIPVNVCIKVRLFPPAPVGGEHFMPAEVDSGQVKVNGRKSSGLQPWQATVCSLSQPSSLLATAGPALDEAPRALPSVCPSGLLSLLSVFPFEAPLHQSHIQASQKRMPQMSPSVK